VLPFLSKCFSVADQHRAGILYVCSYGEGDEETHLVVVRKEKVEVSWFRGQCPF